MKEAGILEGIGLTKGEIKVYLALLENGSSTTGQIVKKAHVSRSKVYEMLERLIERGLASYTIKGDVKYYASAEPINIIKYIEKKKKELSEKEKSVRKILPLLEQRQKERKSIQTAEVYEGKKGIKTIYNDILSSLKKGEEYYATAVDSDIYGESDFKPFIEDYHKERAKKGIRIKLLTTKELKKKFTKTIGKTKLFELKETSQEMPSSMLIYDDKVVNFVWSKESVGIVTKSEVIAQRYKKWFNSVWKIAKK